MVNEKPPFVCFRLQSRVAEADSLKGELESVKGQLSDANVKLEQQRAKNDVSSQCQDLRSWI